MKQIKMNPLFLLNHFRFILKSKQQYGMGRIEVPAIIAGIKTEYFFEAAYETQQEWVTKTLDITIKKINK